LYVDAGPVAVMEAGPFLMAMQDHVVAFCKNALEVHPLVRILPGHFIEVCDERILAISDFRVVLDVDIANVFSAFGSVAYRR
jgi:hypothetical protein